MCTRNILPFKGDYGERLSQINIDVLCLKGVSKVKSYYDHVDNDSLQLSQNVGQTSLYDELLLKEFSHNYPLSHFSHRLICLDTLVGEYE